MSARVTIAAVVLAAAAVGAGAFAFLAMSEAPPGETDTGGSLPTERVTDSGDGGVRPPAQDPDAAPAPADGAPWIEIAGFDEAQRAIDWETVGATYAELVPLLEARARAVTRDRPLPDAEQQRIDDLWSALDDLAEPLRERTQYLYGNGVFVHPAYLANSVPATLHARGRGVTQEQLDRLAEMMRAAAAQDGDIEALHGDDMMNAQLRGMVEIEARRGLTDGVHDLLNERQQRLLHPGELRSRIGLDPFSAVEVLRGNTTLIVFEQDREGSEQLVDAFSRELTVSGVTRAQCIALLAIRVREMAVELFPEGARRLDAAGHVLLEPALIAMRNSGEFAPQIVMMLTEGQPPLIPPDVAERPIIVVRAPQD